MQAASEALEFEKAMEFRDLLTSVRQVAQKQKITSFDGEDRDILALAMDDRDAVVQVFFVREGRLIGREHFHVTIGAEDTKKEVLSTFISQYYAGTPFVPRGDHAPYGNRRCRCSGTVAVCKTRTESIYPCA